MPVSLARQQPLTFAHIRRNRVAASAGLSPSMDVGTIRSYGKRDSSWAGIVRFGDGKVIRNDAAHAHALGKAICALGLTRPYPGIVFSAAISPDCLLRITAISPSHGPSAPRQHLAPDKASHPTETVGEPDWFWEGNVQKAIAVFLSEEDRWKVGPLPDATRREHGHDILATKGKRTLAIEIKGYPSLVRTSGARQGTQKHAGQRNLQAKMWFGQALFEQILRKSVEPNWEYALGFPDMPPYPALAQHASGALASLDIGLYFVKENGEVQRRVEDGRHDRD